MYFILDEVRSRVRERDIQRENELYRILSMEYSQNPYRKGSNRAKLWDCEKRELENEYKKLVRSLYG